MPISLPEAEDEHEQKPEAKGDQSPRERKGVGHEAPNDLNLRITTNYMLIWWMRVLGCLTSNSIYRKILFLLLVA
jgi:hypothetical protein